MSQASAERSWNVALRAQADDSLELAVYDVIGQTLFGDGVTSKDLLGKLRGAPKAKTINLRVNSAGGLVDEAKAMVNILAERASAGVEIVGWVDGLAASSAAYLLTAAKRVVMPSNTFQMIHGVRGGVRGTAEDVEAGAALMRRTNEQLAEAFAAASARRGKGKTKEDFLAAFAAGDLYLDADEAIAWGLADEKIEATKLAACLADLSGLEHMPRLLASAPYVTLNGAAPQPKTPSAREGQDNNPPPQSPEINNMTQAAVFNLVAIATVLGFTAEAAAEADEQAVTGAIKKLQASARVGREIEKLVDTTGDAAIGAVRALVAGQEQLESLTNDLGVVKGKMARTAFEGARDQGLKDKKLTQATAKLYTDRFEAAVSTNADDAERIAAELQGFLKVAPRIVSSAALQPGAGEGGGDPAALQHNGKTYAQLKPLERARLKQSDPELYNLMRTDWQQSQSH